jgi:hypothetical protein
MEMHEAASALLRIPIYFFAVGLGISAEKMRWRPERWRQKLQSLILLTQRRTDDRNMLRGCLRVQIARALFSSNNSDLV